MNRKFWQFLQSLEEEKKTVKGALPLSVVGTDTDELISDYKVYGNTTLNADNSFNVCGDLVEPSASITNDLQTRITANGLKVANNSKTTINKITGKTIKCENLLPKRTKSTTVGGVTITYDDVDNTFVLNGTFTAVGGNIPLIGESYDYFKTNYQGVATLNVTEISGTAVVGEGTGITYSYGIFDSALTNFFRTPVSNLTYKSVSVSDQFPNSSDNEYIAFLQIGRQGTTFDNYKVRIMLNAGPSALPYQPYFTDLKSATVTGLTSTGKNVIDEINYYSKSIYWTYESGTWTGNNPYYQNLVFKIKEVIANIPFTYSFNVLDEGRIRRAIISKTPDISNVVSFINVDIKGVYGKTYTPPDSNELYLIFTGYKDNENFIINNIQIEYGSSATQYEPYISNALTFSGTVTRNTGVRAYQSGDDTDTSVITDGTNTVYLLTAPTTEDFTSSTELRSAPAAADELVLIPNTYRVWANGSETVTATADANGLTCYDYGAAPTLYNTYILNDSQNIGKYRINLYNNSDTGSINLFNYNDLVSIGIIPANAYGYSYKNGLVTATATDKATGAYSYLQLILPSRIFAEGQYTGICTRTNNTNNEFRWYYTSANGNIIKPISLTNSATFSAADLDAYDYVAIYIYLGANAQGTVCTVKDIQIAKAADGSVYYPFHNGIYDTYLVEPLRKAGDIADVIDEKTNTVTRYIKEFTNTTSSTVTVADCVDSSVYYSTVLGVAKAGSTITVRANEKIFYLTETPRYETFDNRTDLFIASTVNNVFDSDNQLNKPSQLEITY